MLVAQITAHSTNFNRHLVAIGPRNRIAAAFVLRLRHREIYVNEKRPR